MQGVKKFAGIFLKKGMVINMSWKDLVRKHDPRESNIQHIEDYITKDTEEARALEHLYNEWKKTNMDYNSRQFAILKLFALGLDDFGTMGWEA